jgi:hypothetical protein
MPGKSAQVSTTTVEVARASLVPVTHRPCWAIHGTHVFVGSGCPLQMARGSDSSVYHITEYYSKTEDNVCDARSPRNHCFRQ